jgi:GAF domain-containing protein
MVARTVSELRAAVPETGDLLAGLLRVAAATRTALEVDGAGLTLVHEDGLPRWVAATDAAMELLEQVQHDFGEGPCLQAYTQDQVVAVPDLRSAPVWSRIDAVVGQLHVSAVLSVPVRLAEQPIGTLDVYSTQLRAWTTHELAAVGEFAAMAGELVHTSVELATRELELAQLRQALTSRVWIEQAKGVLAVTQGVGPDEAFQQLRRRARASSRKLAELAREVVQEAQRERLAALALDDVRVREAEARARAAEQALEAAQADLIQRRAALDQSQVAATERDRIADERNHAADERDRAADARERASTSPRRGTGPLMSASAWPMTATASLTNGAASPTSGTGRPASRTDPAVRSGSGRPLQNCSSLRPTGKVRGPESASARPGPCTRPRSADAPQQVRVGGGGRPTRIEQLPTN